MISPGLFSTADMPHAVAEANQPGKSTRAPELPVMPACLAGIPGAILIGRVYRGCRNLAPGAPVIVVSIFVAWFAAGQRVYLLPMSSAMLEGAGGTSFDGPVPRTGGT